MAKLVHTLLFPLAILLATLLAMSSAASTKSKDKQIAVGGLREDDLKSKETQRIVNFAVSTYNDMNNDLYFSRPIWVVSASQQVVTGKNYYLKIELGQTVCAKSQPHLADCPFNEQSDQQKKVTCNFQISTDSQMNEISVTNFSCHSV